MKLALLVLASSVAFGQPWTGILSSSRAIDWTHAGLPATLPDGEATLNPWTPPTRTQCGATVNPSGLTNGTDVTNINNALASCTAGHYVLLAAGTFYIQNANNCYGGSASCIPFFNPATGTTPRNGITLRGSGAQSTILRFTGNSLIAFSVSSNIGSCSWTAGYASGTTSLTTASCSGPALTAGMIATLSQCDSGWSGATCATGSSVDDGALYVCKNTLACAQQIIGGTNNMQNQVVYVAGVSGNTVTIAAPGLYMPNWQLSRTPKISWPQFQTYGDGVEDLTVYAPSGSSATYLVNLGTAYGSWVKGVRFLGSGNNAPLGVQASKNALLANNYLFSDIAIDANYPPPVQTDSSSDVLILNNMMTSSVPWEGNGGNQGNVMAYNYTRDTFTGFMENIIFDHHGGSMFFLTEGNQFGGILDDDTFGTHDLNTSFRNYLSGWDPPYVQASPRGWMVDDYQRFDNAIGNAIGSQYITTYQGSGDNVAFRFLGGDSLALSTSMRWGNCDTATNTCRFQGSEVPTALVGNAIPFQNTVPSSNTLPNSFFLSGAAAVSGGAGLSWWNACTSWTTFPTNCATSQTQPFPAAGPDITGGPYVNGHANDIPASIAWHNLPVDTAFQNSYTITSSSWSGGTETLTISGLPDPTHLMGAFQFSGVNAGCSAGAMFGPNSEILITDSNSTTVRYALTSNPGTPCTGTFKFPDVRQFDERVYGPTPLGPCFTLPSGWCNTGLTPIQDNILGPLTPSGSNPWTFGDLAETGVVANMAPAAIAGAPQLGIHLVGTFSWTQGGATVTSTASQVTALAGRQYAIFTWDSVDGAGTGRMICPIVTVTSTTITCETIREPSASGMQGYLPGNDANLTRWTVQNPSVSWNYYDVAIALYRLYYRTLNPIYLTYARQYADIQWQWTLDHGYRSVAPRASAMLGVFFRVTEGHTTWLPGLYNWISMQEPGWNHPANTPNFDSREGSYWTWDATLGAKVDTDGTRHAQYCSWLAGNVAAWNAAQSADGSWGENEFSINSSYVSAPKSFTPPFTYGGAAWREAINVKALESAYEVLNDTTMQGCSQTALAAATLAVINNAITWQNNYGRDSVNRGIYYTVNSQSNEQESVAGVGTITSASGTAVVGSGTNWLTAGMCDGTHFIGFVLPRTVYKIAACASNTAMTLTVAYGLYGEGAGSAAGSTIGFATAASSTCHSSATYCIGTAGDLNLSRTVCGGEGWLYSKTLNPTLLGWVNECLSAVQGGPTAGLNINTNARFVTLPCSGPACNGYVNDMVVSAATCGVPPCIYSTELLSNLGKNYGEAWGAPGIDNALAWRLLTSGVVPPTITSVSPLPSGTINVTYSFQFAANGTSPITWSATGLPSWASLSSGGLLTGTPDAITTTAMAISATNSAGTAGPSNFSLTIAGIVPTITSVSPLPGGTNGTPYSFQFTASGSTPITWGATGLPGWASLSSGGLLTGTPNANGTTVIAVTATNSTGNSGPHNFSITVIAGSVAPTITSTSPLPSAPYGVAYSFQFSANGTAPITWGATSLPSWASLSSAGLLTGTPNAVAATTIHVTATNGTGSDGPTDFLLTVPGVVPIITTLSPLPGGVVGVAYSQQFAATGTPTITWSAASLPAWASMSSSGLLTGTPTVAGSNSFTVTATNSAGSDGPDTFILNISPATAPPTITSTSPLTPGLIGTPYTFQFSAVGTTPITWTGTGLPSWSTLSASGLLAGTPSIVGTSTPTVTATNSIGSAGPTGFSLTITGTAPPVTCSPQTHVTPPNVTDSRLQTNMALALVACTNSLTQTGTCTVVDVRRVNNAILGAACLIGP